MSKAFKLNFWDNLTINQKTQIKMIEEKYMCSKFNRDVIGSPGHIILHNKMEMDALPRGLVYMDVRSRSYGIVAELGRIETGLDLDGRITLIEVGEELVLDPRTHSFDQRVLPYSLRDGKFMDPIFRNSREVRQSYMIGNRIVPAPSEIALLQEEYARFLDEGCYGNENIQELLKGLDPDMISGIPFREQSEGRVNEVRRLVEKGNHKRHVMWHKLQIPQIGVLQSA